MVDIAVNILLHHYFGISSIVHEKI